jgi:hypothetical protein
MMLDRKDAMERRARSPYASDSIYETGIELQSNSKYFSTLGMF